MRNAVKFKKMPTASLPEGLQGFLLFSALLFFSAFLLPSAALDPESRNFLFAIGLIAAWRYGWGITNFIRSMIYRKFVFPRWRRKAERGGEGLLPSKMYILMTVYRIDIETASRAIRAAMQEAAGCGVPVTLVASVVEAQDEFLFKSIFESMNLPERVELKIVRIPGTGKRDGLAQGFRAISRDLPPPDAVVAVMDGDTILLPGVLNKCTPFFKLFPRLGALTTDEFCHVRGTKTMREWHDMRFAQRHILMSSISLSKRTMTLTGRMSMFRAYIVTHPDFISHMTQDYLNHWRLGKFRFLTGDDKSSLYWVLSRGYQQIYVPDAAVLTLEDPPSPHFLVASTQLMRRWFGNMLRTNSRILALGPTRMPFFVWWAFLDQRISMWTSLSGPTFAVMLAFKYGTIFIAYYFVWVFFVRWVMTLMIMTARNKVSWRYPFLLYYSHVYGSLIKVWAMFRLDQQSWTRQKTKLARGLSRSTMLWNRWSSHAMHAAAIVIFICAIGYASQVMGLPHATLRLLAGPAYAGI
jgi:glycosyltransferase Alg8